LDIGWEVLSLLPRDELHRVKEEMLEQHYRPPAAGDGPARAAEGKGA
jgi:V/A-type H+-transporting ATPase subunit B